MKKTMTLAAAGAAAALTMTGCGSDGTAEAPPPEPSATAVEQTEAPAAVTPPAPSTSAPEGDDLRDAFMAAHSDPATYWDVATDQCRESLTSLVGGRDEFIGMMAMNPKGDTSIESVEIDGNSATVAYTDNEGAGDETWLYSSGEWRPDCRTTVTTSGW